MMKRTPFDGAPVRSVGTYPEPLYSNVLPATSAEIAAVEALKLPCVPPCMSAASRRAFRIAAARSSPAFVVRRKLNAFADPEITGEVPSAASKYRLKVEKLANAGEAKASCTAAMSSVVPVGLKGASGPESPQAPRATHAAASRVTERFVHCRTRIGRASVS